MPTCAPLLDALKAEKSYKRGKEAIQRNHSHYKDAAQAPKEDDSKRKAATASSAGSDAKQGGDLTAPLGKRAAKRAAAAAAAHLVSAQAGSTTQPKTGNTSTAQL
jgi:regulator of nonsense transcripts 3